MTHRVFQHSFKFPQLSVCITMCNEAEREREEGGGEREREVGVTVDNHERLARSELAGRPTLNQRHRRVNLPSTPLGDRRSSKRPNPLDGVPRLEGSAVRQSNLGKPQPRQIR